MLYAFTISLVLITIGELADKSQLLALCLATKYKTWHVLLGIFLATFAVHFVSTAAGQLIGGLLPGWLLPWVSGVLFIGFGIWTLRGDTIDEEKAADSPMRRYGPIAAVAGAFFLAELGDKTQIMTMTIAADPGAALVRYLGQNGSEMNGILSSLGAGEAASRAGIFWGVTLGSTLGMVLADAVAIFAGRMLGRRLPEKLLARVSGIIFIVFGLITIALQYR